MPALQLADRYNHRPHCQSPTLSSTAAAQYSIFRRLKHCPPFATSSRLLQPQEVQHHTEVIHAPEALFLTPIIFTREPRQPKSPVRKRAVCVFREHLLSVAGRELRYLGEVLPPGAREHIGYDVLVGYIALLDPVGVEDGIEGLDDGLLGGRG